MRVGPRCPGGVAAVVAEGAPGIPVAVGATGSNAAFAASDADGGLVATGAGATFFVEEAVDLEDFLAAVDLPELLLLLAEEDLADGFDGLEAVLLEVGCFAVLFDDFDDFDAGCAFVSSVAAPTEAGSAIQQAIVDRSATTRRTVRPRMGCPSANRRGCAPVNA